MEGGRGEVGYEIVVESAIEICILSIILSCWPTCSKGWWQTMHCRPIADNSTLAVLDIEMLKKWWLANSAFSPQSARNRNLYEFWGVGPLIFYFLFFGCM